MTVTGCHHSRRDSASALLLRRPRSSQEYERACAFASERYRAAGYVTTDAPFDHPEVLLVMTRGPSLIGSLGIESAEDGRLPTERAFGFECDHIPGTRRSRTFECSRLAVAHGEPVTVFKALIAGAMIYAQQRREGPVFLLTVTRKVDLLMRHCHLRPERLPYPLADDTLRRDFPAYWAADPPPYPIYIPAISSERAIARLAADLAGAVQFELGPFDRDPAPEPERAFRQRGPIRVRPDPSIG